MTEEMTSFGRPVTVSATEVVSRSQGKASVVRTGSPWKKFHSRSCSTRETRSLIRYDQSVRRNKVTNGGECLRITGGLQYQQLGKVLLEGNTVGGNRIQGLCVPLQVGPGTLDGILDGITDGLNDAFLIVEDYATHPKRAGREHILWFVIDEYDRAGVDGDIVEDMPVKPEVGFSLAGVGGSVDLVEQRPVCWLCPEILMIGMGDVRHGIYSELATRLVLQFANEIEHLVIRFERVTRLVKRFRDLGGGDVEFV